MNSCSSVNTFKAVVFFCFVFFKLTPLAKVTCDLTVSPGLYPVLINKLMDKNSWKH